MRQITLSPASTTGPVVPSRDGGLSGQFLRPDHPTIHIPSRTAAVARIVSNNVSKQTPTRGNLSSKSLLRHDFVEYPCEDECKHKEKYEKRNLHFQSFNWTDLIPPHK